MFKQKIAQILENYNFCSKRASSSFLKNNKVFVNEERILDLSKKIDTDEEKIFINGKALKKAKNIYILFNKPLGVVCSAVSDSHKTVFDFIKNRHKNKKNCAPLHIAGRLDSLTSGLVLLTTNGAFSHFVTAPETHLKKIYKIELEEKVSLENQKKYILECKKGIFLAAEKKDSEYFTKSADLVFNSENICTLCIKEGRFHQVRRMMSALGLTIKTLKRISIGPFSLDDLKIKEGKYKIFSQKEIKRIFNKV